MFRAIKYRTPFLSKIYRSAIVNIARSNLPYTSQESDKNNEDIILLRLAVGPTFKSPATAHIDDGDHSTGLAGDPRSIISFREQIRAEVLAKWNQRPKLDMDKEWIKYSIYY